MTPTEIAWGIAGAAAEIALVILWRRWKKSKDRKDKIDRGREKPRQHFIQHLKRA